MEGSEREAPGESHPVFVGFIWKKRIQREILGIPCSLIFLGPVSTWHLHLPVFSNPECPGSLPSAPAYSCGPGEG